MDTGVSGYIGEQFTLIELLRNGFDAYLPPSSTKNEFDILVLLGDKEINKEIKIQVKAVDWSKSSNPTIVGNFNAGGFDYLMIVFINFSNSPYKLFIVPKDNLIMRTDNELYRINNYSKINGKKGKKKTESILIDKNINILYYSSSDRKDKKANINIKDYEIDEVREKVDKYYCDRWDLIR